MPTTKANSNGDAFQMFASISSLGSTFCAFCYYFTFSGKGVSAR